MKIILKKDQSLFLTSDSHYSHTNICRGVSAWEEGRGTRDFETLEEMNSVIVNSINSKVGEDDILFHLGDWSFGGFDKIQEFRDQIKCKNIHLILGNHDHHIKKDKNGVRKNFVTINSLLELSVNQKSESEIQRLGRFVLCHYPISSWPDMSSGVIHLHGHVHLGPDKKLHEGRAMDVGMDGNNFTPYNLKEILSIMKGREIKKLTLPSDHHEII